jgi:hypothetical protein
MYTSIVTVAKGGDLELISYGRGAAYVLWRGNDSIFVQDDAAVELRETRQQLEASRPTAAAAEILRELWEMYSP